MSQLDMSIAFNQLCGLIFCFYIFMYCMMMLLMQFWYNQKLRSLSQPEYVFQFKELNSTFFLKKILKL